MNRAALLLIALAMCLLAAAACTSTGNTPAPVARVEIREVRVQVPVPCNVDVPPEPAYPDTAAALRAAPDLERGTRLLLAGRELRTAYGRAVLAALLACKSPTTMTPPAQ